MTPKKTSSKKKAAAKKPASVAALDTLIKGMKRKSPGIGLTHETIAFVFEPATESEANNNVMPTARGGGRGRRWVCRFKNGRWQCGWE